MFKNCLSCHEDFSINLISSQMRLVQMYLCLGPSALTTTKLMVVDNTFGSSFFENHLSKGLLISFWEEMFLIMWQHMSVLRRSAHYLDFSHLTFGEMWYGAMLSLKLRFHSALQSVTLNSFVLLACNFTGGSFWASKPVEEGKRCYCFVLQVLFTCVA